MIVPKLNYVLIFLWLVFRGIQLNKECKMNLFYATTKVLGPPCFYQARRVKKHVTLLSVHQFVHGLILLQRSSLPLMLILLANDVELNPGPINLNEQLEQSSSIIKNDRNSVSKSFRCLCWNTRSLFSLHNLSLQDFIYTESIDIVFLTETWLSDKHFDAEILSQDYDVFRVDRKCRTGGGFCRTLNKFCHSILVHRRSLSKGLYFLIYFSQLSHMLLNYLQ